MKKKILRLRKLLSLVKRQKIPVLAYLQNIVIWTILISSLLASCSQEEKSRSLLFEEQGEQIAVSTEDYAITFVEDEVAIKLPTGQSVTAMNVGTSNPILEGNKVIYEDIAEQTDLIFYDKGTGNAGYDIVLEPHAHPENIRINLENESMYITEEGELVIPVENGEIRHSAPLAYQKIDEKRVEVESSFVLYEDSYGFEVGKYDANYELIIDPEIYVSYFDISGSNITIVSGDPVTAGISSTVDFQLNTVSPDQEYIIEVILTAPAGWTLTRNSEDASSGTGNHTVSVSGSGTNSITYNITATSGTSFPGVRNGQSWGIDIDVLAPNGISGSNNIAYTLNGDAFGAPPNNVSGNVSLNVDPGLDPNVVCVNVFRDYNSNGTDEGNGEPAISSVTVTAYDATNNATVLTNNNDGSYTFTPGNADTYRIEITGLSGNLEPSSAGPTTTFFMSRGTKVEVGLNEPAEHYENTVYIATPCYVDGPSNGANANGDVLVIVPKDEFATGIGNQFPQEYFVAEHDEIGSTFGVAYSRSANSLFAAAFTKRHTAFGPGGTGGIYKIDLNGDEPTAPISSTSVSTFIDLNSLFGMNTAGVDPHPNATADFNRDPDAYDAVGKVGLGGLAISETENTLWTINLADRRLYEMPLGGTRENPTAPAMGDISRWPASGDLTDLPNLPGTAGERDANVRPFAVKCHKGDIYIGVVYTAESTVVYDVGTNTVSNTGTQSDLQGYVYKFDPDTDVFTQVLSFPLDYAREQAVDFCSNNGQAEFFPWAPIYDKDVFETAVIGTSRESGSGATALAPERVYPQPWITDIEFDEDGKMIVGLRDRFGDQHGFKKLPPSTTGSVADSVNVEFNADAAGDILVASINTMDNTTYVIENNSSNGTNGAAFGPTTGQGFGEGPGNGEFFFDDRYRPANASADGGGTCPGSAPDINDQDPPLNPDLEQGHDEISLGGLFNHNGTNNVIVAVYDPINDFNNFNQAGFLSLSNQDGSRQGASLVYTSQDFDGGTPDDPNTFGKGNGLGDAEGISAAAPLQIGNRLWLDANSNGRQDPDEDGINGVLVELYKETSPSTFTKVAERTTASDAIQGNGFFIFSDDSDMNQIWVSGTEVLPEMNYEIRISLAAVQAQDGTVQAFASVNGGGVTDNNNKTDLNDSDADASGIIAFTTGIEGQNNHTLDIGVVAMPPCVLTINSSTPDATCTGGTYDVDFALTWTDAPTMGDFEVSIDGGMNFTTVTRTDFGASSSETITLTGVTCDGAMKSVQIRFANETTCLAASSYTAPALPTCSLTINSSTPDATCTGGTYDVGFALTWTDAPTMGDFEVSIDGGMNFTTVTRTDFGASSSETITLTGVTCDGAMKSVQIRFANDITCSAASSYTAPSEPILGAIGNYVWLDENSDGLQDAGEPGIPNVKVILRDVSGDPIDSTLTSPDGSYLFPDLISAMYFVDIDESTLPDTDGNAMTQDLTQTTIFTNVVDGSDADTDNDDGDFGNKDHSANGNFGYKITLDEGEENLTADFGYNYNPTDDVNNPMGSPLGALGDRVWYDADQDGVQDPEEAGVEGVTLKLIAASDVTVGGMMFSAGDQIATDVTDENGFYLFDGLPAGAYNVMVADDANGTGTGGPLDGFEQTGDPDHFATSEGDNPDDSVEDDNMTTKPVVLGPGDVFLNVDFGYDNDAVLGSIGDYVWLDADADGNGPNANGATGTPINQGAGSVDDSAEQPIEGITVALIKDSNGDGKWDEGEPIIASDVTDADGLYYFPGLPTGADADYLVLVTDTDNVLDGLKPTYDGDNNGETMPTDNYPRGQMANMELGLSSVTDLGTTPVLNQDFGYTPDDQDAGEGLIGDYVWYDTNNDGVQDDNESGIEGVKVDLYQAYEVINASIDVDGDGDVDADDDGTLDGIAIIDGRPDINGDGNTNGDDDGSIFGVSVINGRVDIDGNGLVNAANRPDDDGVIGEVVDTACTDENGYYQFGGLAVDADGIGYQVKVAESGGGSGEDNFAAGGVLEGLTNTYDPNDMTTSPDDMGGIVSLTTADPIDLDQDFGYVADPMGTVGSLGNKIFEDLNANGVRDAGEMGFNGVTVDLYRDLNGNGELDPGEPKIGSTVTANAMGDDGMYLFENLPIDSFIVDVTDVDGILAGYWHTDGNQDPQMTITGDTADDSEGSPMGDNSKTDAFSVGLTGAVPNNLNVDFGYYKDPAAVGNYVWLDEDGDGQQDAAEPGIEDVVVSMMVTYPDGTMITLTDTTDADGFYEFPNLLLDEDYRIGAGTGANGEDPAGVDPSGTLTPKYVIKVDENQATLTNAGYTPTLIDESTGGITDEDDSDAFSGVVAIPVQGSQDTDLFKTDGTLATANDEEVEASYDFGVLPAPILGAIGNYVWLDENSDGLQDAGEPGIPNVAVILKDGMGNPLDTTYTDSEGGYLFPDLPAGDYNVDIDDTTLPDGVSQTTIFTNVVDSDDDDTVTDDGDLGNKDHSGNGYPITLDEGEENLTADFGYNYNPTPDVNDPTGSPTAALGDRIWIDSDGDGVQDPNEIGVSGAEVTLTTPGTDGILGTADDMMLMDTTDENGNYLFDNLPPGAYTVEVTDDDDASHNILNDTNYDQTGDPDHFATSEADNPDDSVEDNDKTDDPVVLGPGDVFLNVDFGYQPEDTTPLGSIGNTVWLDADADGNGPADSDPIGSDGDNGTGTEDDNNEQPIAGVSVSLIQDTNGDGVWNVGESIIATDVTDENGNYLFEDLPLDDDGGDMDADYIVWVNDTDNVLDGLKPTFDEDGGVSTPATGFNDDTDMVGGMSSVALSSGTPDNRDQDFGYTPEEQDAGEGAIGDYVWYDTDMDGVQDPEEAGIEGVTVYLIDLGADEMIGGGDDVLIDSTLTDENGGYLFGGLPVDADGEAYQVQIAPSNFDMGEPLEGLENTFDPDDMTTNPDSQGGVVSLTTATPVNLDQDFGYVGDDANTLGSIGNQVWEDTDADGVYEPNGADGVMGTADDETPLEGVTIDLYRDLDGNGEIDPGEPRIGTTTTDANGMYLFDELPLDDYVVDVTDVDGVLAGYWHSTGSQDASTNGGDDPMDNSKEDAFAVTIDATTPDNLNVDFGYYKEPAAVGNYVWVDENRDGLQNDGETGLNDVVVTMTITYPDATTVTLTDTTMNDASGNPGFYEFPNLLADEDYAQGAGTGTDGEAPAGVDPSGTMTPKYVISVDANQSTLTSGGYKPTTADATTDTNDPLNDSEDFAGVVAIPVQGSQNTAAVDPSTDETAEAKYDFGVQPETLLGAIGNYVWLDENSDGLQDAGEPGIPNVKVVLKDMDGNPIDSTLTDPKGGYLFPDLPEAMYFVDVDESTLPNTDGDAMTQDLTQTTIFTNIVDGSDADIDNDDGDFGNKDHSANGGFGYKITLDEGEENLTADFGYNYNPTDDVNNPMGSPLGALGDRVWYDADQDGVQDPNEAGVEGVTVKLIAASIVTIGMTTYNVGDQIATDVTDANGNYLFDGLPAGAYNVMIADDATGTGTGGPLDGFMQTGDPDHFATSEADNPDDSVEDDNMTTKPVVLGPGDVFLNVDFGYDNDNDLGAIGDFVWLDADADGSGPNAAGATGTPVNQGNGSADDSGEQPIEGVSVALIKDTNGDGKWDEGEPIIASDVTDENGLYYFPGLPAGNGEDYLVLVTDTDNVLNGLKPTYDGDNNSEIIPTDNYPRGQMANMELGLSAVTDLITGAGNEVLNQDFGYIPEDQDAGEGLIGDYVWYDTNGDGVQDPEESGIEGVKMYLFDGMGTLLDSTLTDENGYYYFGGLPVDADGEDYQVTVADDNFDPGQPLEDLENTYDPDDLTATPNAEGGVITLDTGRPIDLIQDFGFVGDDVNPLGSLGNKIFEDLNANGVRDAGEMGFNGVTVDLYRDLNSNGQLDPGEPKIGSTVTANAMGDDGMYLFENLPLDSFIVDVTDVNGVLAGYWHTDGSQDPTSGVTGDTADDASGNPMGDNSKTDAFSVGLTGAVPNNLNVDFGYYKDPAAVGNYVWEDTDGDGQQDVAEPGVEDVVVSMMVTYPDGTMITLYDTTDANGFYEFPNLLIDEDYRIGIGEDADIMTPEGTGANATDPVALNPIGTQTPKFVIKVDAAQDALSGFEPTTQDATTGGITDKDDSDAFSGVVAIPVQGNEDTDQFKTDAMLADATAEEVEASYDFGVRLIPILGAIGNYVWLDENSDGLQDAGESGIPNVKVILRDVSGNPIDSTLTSSDGSYLFPDLPSAMYFVDVDESTLPNTDGDAMTQDLTQTTIFTNIVDGSDVDTDNDDGDFGNKDHSANGGFGYKITLDPGEENLTADFGYNYNPTDDVNNPMGSPLGALGDRVWYDADQDGVQDPNEAGVEGVIVKLIAASTVTIGMTTYNAGDQIATDVTDANGNYLFDGLPAGAYNVMIADDANGTGTGGPLDGFMQTGDPDHFATSEADNPDDSVEDDNMTTKPVVLGPGDVFLNVDFGYDNDAVLGSIGDYVWLDADADGNGPNATGATGTPVNQGAGTTDDSAEQPIEGVSVVLIKDTNGDGKWDEGEPIIANDVTDEDGLYYFPGLPTGADADYLVLVTDTDNVLDGLKPTYDGDNNNETMPTDNYPRGQMANMELGLSAVMDLSTTAVLNQDFGYTPEEQNAGEGLIGDYVWYDINMDGVQDPEESGIEGVVVELYDDMGNLITTTTTDENGEYHFGGLPLDESYQVKIAESGNASGENNFAAGSPLEGLTNTSDPDNGAVVPNDNMGGLIMLTAVNPVNLDQDFGYVGDDDGGNITLGSIGNQVWEDFDADGIYEPNGADGMMGTADDETPLEGVTIDLYRDLDGNGELDPGEPRIGTTTTDANGMYLFDELPLDDYVVDVTDVDGVLAGYWHSTGSQDASTNGGDDPMDNSKEDAFAVTIDATTPDNLNVDFGYYKEPAAIGNYVFADNNANGLQDAGDTPIADVVVQMDITYPDGTMVSLTDTTDANGFYEFPNLLLDEDYAQGAGTGADGEDPTGVNSSGTQTPKYVISVNPNQDAFTDNNLVPTMADVTSNMNDPLNDSEEFDGVVAIPVQGSENTDAATMAMDASGSANEAMEAKYDFGARPELDLATNIMISSMTPPQGYYDEDDPIEFMVNVFNQGAVAVSDVTITNYLPSELENPALVANSLMINGMTAPMGVTIVKMGNDYVIDFGTDPNNWFDSNDQLSFKFTADITDDTTPGTEITNTIEISDYDTDNNTTTPRPDDVDSVADANNGGDGETMGTGLDDDETDEDAANNTGDDSDDHDVAIVPTGEVLPVELLGFEAKADKDHIDLVWSTASEYNNSHFELERSEDGKVFKQIARVEGQGTTLEQADYDYEDEEVIPGVLYYYRLKQVDIDGVFEYSEIRTAKFDAIDGGMELYPNPIGDATELQVRFYTTELTKEFVIMDIHSRSVLQVKQDLRNTGWNTMSIDIQILPAGTYLILDKDGNSLRFVKARE